MRTIAAWIIIRYLRFFAWVALLIHRPVVIGIAGSVGKSSTKQALYAILRDVGPTRFTTGNSETGVPLGILDIRLKGYGILDWLMAIVQCPLKIFNLRRLIYLIVEMGIDDPLPPKNMGYLLTIVKPDVAVILNESATHTMQFEKILSQEEKKLSREQRLPILIRRIADEDAKMVNQQRCRTLIYNADNEYVRKALKTVLKDRPELKVATFGQSPSDTATFGKHEITLEKSNFELFIEKQRISVEIPNHILPREYREVFTAALLVARALKFDLVRASLLLQKNFSLPKGRASLFKGINDSVIIDSSYNASRVSVFAFLDLVFQLKQKTGRPVVFACGDMRELGEIAAQEHQTVAERIPSIVDYLYCVGPLTKQYIIPIAEKRGLEDIKWFSNSRELGAYMKDHLPEGALVLVKGSQNQIFLEEAIKLILKNKEDEKKLCRQEGYWKKF